MSKIEITKSHALGQTAALDRAKQMVERFQDEGISGQSFGGEWRDNVYVVKTPVTGMVTVGASSVSISLDLPWILGFMRGQIEDRINAELDRALAG